MKILLTLTLLVSVGIASAQKSANLSYQLEQNKTYRAKSVNAQSTKMKIQGMEQSSEAKNTNFISLKPLSFSDDFFMAAVKFDSMFTTNTMPPININSNKKGDITSEDPMQVMQSVVNRLTNSTLLVKMSYSGKVLQITNYDVIVKNILAGTESLKGMAAMVKPQIDLMISENALKGMIEIVTAYLPGIEVKKGDKWDTEVEISAGGMGSIIKSKYTLNDITKSGILISGDVILEPASSEPMVMNGAEITSNLKGLGKSEMTIDLKTGWIIKGTSKSQMTGEMNVNAPGQSMQMPMDVISTSEITSEF